MLKPYPSNELRIRFIRLKRLVKSFFRPAETMSVENSMPQLRMAVKTPELKFINPMALPVGYHQVQYRPSVNLAWRNLINESDEFGQLSEDAFYLALLDKLIPGGAGLIRFRDELTACASINYQDSAHDIATVNYVLTKPAHRGYGLGGIAVAIALNSAREAGVATVQLFTDDARLAAIKLYLKLGFKPDYVPDDQQMEERWGNVFSRLEE